jgi:dTMP kinase
MQKQGKLFVIDGVDGSGKTDQTALLIERMRREGFPVETIDFPQYDSPTGKAVKAYLTGALGDPTKVDAKTASMLYADDRLAHWPKMKAWLDAGINVVANRYVASNMAHQGSKLASIEDKVKFWEWEEELEFGKNGIGRPALNVILYVPVDVSLMLIAKRGNVPDGHETRVHLQAAADTYKAILGWYRAGFRLIDCGTRDGKGIVPRDEIHELVWQHVKPALWTKP